MLGITPFIVNIDHKPTEPVTKTLTENGKYDTKKLFSVDVKVEEASELTEAAQEELLEENF